MRISDWSSDVCSSDLAARQPAMSGAGRRLSLQVVERPCACDAFLRLPWRLYRDDPAWIPPLLLERRQHLDPRHNPFFATAETRFWIALRDGLPVAIGSAACRERGWRYV